MAHRISMGFDWQGAMDRDKAFARAEVADAVGVDTLFAAEAWGRDAFSLLTQLAGRTQRIKLGTSIVNIYSRTPAALAQHFATLDELSDGRVIIGLGNSGPNVIEHFRGDPLNYDGQIVKLERGFTLRFEPVRKEVPIFLATLNPKAVQMTAEIADGWLPVMIPLSRLRDEVDQVQAWARSAGQDAAAFTVRAPGGVTVANTPEAVETARQRQAGTLAFYCARMGEFYYRQLSRQGYEDEANGVRAAWKEGGSQAGAAALPSEMLEQFGFVGNTEQCLARLQEEADAGANLHSVTVMEDDPDRLGRALEVLVG